LCFPGNMDPCQNTSIVETTPMTIPVPFETKKTRAELLAILKKKQADEKTAAKMEKQAQKKVANEAAKAAKAAAKAQDAEKIAAAAKAATASVLRRIIFEVKNAGGHHVLTPSQLLAIAKEAMGQMESIDMSGLVPADVFEKLSKEELSLEDVEGVEDATRMVEIVDIVQQMAKVDLHNVESVNSVANLLVNDKEVFAYIMTQMDPTVIKDAIPHPTKAQVEMLNMMYGSAPPTEDGAPSAQKVMTTAAAKEAMKAARVEAKEKKKALKAAKEAAKEAAKKAEDKKKEVVSSSSSSSSSDSEDDKPLKYRKVPDASSSSPKPHDKGKRSTVGGKTVGAYVAPKPNV